MADVRLEEDSVLLDGTYAKFQSADLWLDHPARRSAGAPNFFRRALVHDFNDSLAINYTGDYPQGVRIFGKVSVDFLEIQQGILVGDITWPPTAAEIQSAVMPPSELAEFRAFRDQIATLVSRVAELERRVGP